GPVAPGNEVVIAAIDEKSIDKLGRWPWPRRTMADLAEKLSAYDAKVFGFDVVFSSPETTGTAGVDAVRRQMEAAGRNDGAMRELLAAAEREADGDQLLADALKRSRRAVLGYFFHFSPQGLAHLTEGEMAAYLASIAKSRYSGVKKEAGTSLLALPLRRAYAVEANVEAVSGATSRAGYFNFYPAADGSVRTVPLLVQYRDYVERPGEDDHLYPPLALSVLRKYLKSAVLIMVDPKGVRQVALMGRKNIAIPADPQGEMRINYYGPRGTFPHYSIADIIEGTVPAEALRGKIVLIGPTAPALEDLRITPFDTVFPGVEVHATVIDNILHHRVLTGPPLPARLIDAATVIAVGIVLLLLLLRLGAVGGSLAVAAMAGAVLGGHYYLFSRHLMVVDSVPPLLEIGLVSLALPVYRFVRQESEKRFIQGAFSQYLSPVVIEQLLRDPSQLQLGGSRRTMTVFFSDVAGFSSFSERMDSEALVKFLNEYLTAMSEIVLRHRGTIDKYEGDAIIAFFGAPLEDPGHARSCCLMALEMQERLTELQEGWRARGLPGIEVRMGINTGPMVVGNMGSAMRMDYTVMGDAVNLAARLEGANKQYGSRILISRETHEACGDGFEVRELDAVRVVGKQEVVVIYELLARKGELDDQRRQMLALFNEGVRLYKERKWERAVEVFSRIIDLDPADGPALTYLERCLDFQVRPPGKHWDGVHIMKTK
ncbi:MAG: adenylate/guanylate cyclase domain-containing protein, partial [Desulfobacteraceae bacterium]|nr:adenylate/guanylate cyclase domain-containing protein [Desulfobacteraceae bacterium]